MKGFRISPKKLYRKFEKVCQMHNDNESSWMTTFFAGNPYRSRVKQEQFETNTAEFEGHSISVPKDVDQLLTQIYGNYMEIPPEEKRVNHAPQFLDFGEGDVFAKRDIQL